MSVRPFTIRIPEATLTDLRQRLAHTRWPDELQDVGWDYGSPLTYVKELVEYWYERFDWRAQERLLNAFPHFRAEVDGLGIHFIHARGQGPNPLPLVVTHGWPGTFFEMYKIIPRLTDPARYGGDPADAFDVIVPSMPGYGFSDHPRQRGMHVLKVSDLWVKLMTDVLGYQRFGAQGGDWGASVTNYLGFAYPQHLVGIHTTSITRPTPYLGAGARALSAAEQAFMAQREAWLQDEGGYSHIQGTKAQTLAYGLNDSPAGLAAWIVEKYRTWSDCHGQVETRFTKEELLTTLTIYWVTQTISSSTRLYYETQRHPWNMQQGEKVNTPTAVAVFPREISRPPREWGERSFNIQRWTEMASGGHFAALEEPDALVEDVRAFFRTVR